MRIALFILRWPLALVFCAWGLFVNVGAALMFVDESFLREWWVGDGVWPGAKRLLITGWRR